MIVCIILFSVIFGVAAAVRQAELDRLDKEHDQQQEQERQEEQDKANQDATTTQKNEQANQNPGINNGSGQVGSQIDFSTFASMYTTAEKNLKNASTIRSTIEGGKIDLSGPTNYGGIRVDHEQLDFKFERGRVGSTGEQLIMFTVSGPMLNGLFVLNYTTELYSNSAVYKYYFNQQKPAVQTISRTAQLEKFGWTINDTIHSAPESAIKSSTDVLYDRISKTYTASADIDVSKSNSKACMFFKGMMSASTQAKYTSCKLTATINENGNFEKIRYQETFEITVYNSEYNAKIDAVVIADYTEVFHSINGDTVSINPPYYA